MTTLNTAAHEEGCELADKMVRVAIAIAQPDPKISDKLRPIYAKNEGELSASNQMPPYQQLKITGSM
ncbi:hexameric tyrosine-coordinated heme protein [Roseovarius sp. D0-M9]|uniref:hexameric tyrosine-coordinated heme protein n=1 Tax=Roseovarius sp. D0-M9 TaxID=3127117 RepID=UPI003FA77A2F